MAFESFNLTDPQYIPQFVGQPLDRLKEVGDTLATRHYENIAKARQLELLGQQQYANAESEADKGYIKSQISGIQGALEEMARSGAENSTAKVGALATRFLGDEGLININKSVQARDREKALMEKLGKSGIMNQGALDAWKKRGTFNPDSGAWEPYTPSAQERLNYMSKQDAVVAPLEADISQTDLTGDIRTTLNALGANFTGDLGTMPTQLKTTVIKALTSKKVQDFIESKGGWESYQDSAEYRQQKDILGMSDQDIKNELKSRAEAKVFQAVNKDWMANRAFDWKAAQKGDTDVDFGPIGEQMANVKIETPDPIGDITDFEVKDRKGKVAIGFNPNTQSGTYGASDPNYKGTASGIPEARWKAFNDYAKVGAEVFGGVDEADKFKDLNEKSDPKLLDQARQYAKQYQQFQKDRQVFMQQDVSFTQREAEEGRSNAEDITTDVQDNIRNRAIYDLETGKLIPVIGDDPEEFSDDFQDAIGSPKNIKVTGSLDPKNFVAKTLKNPKFADAYTAIIRDSENPEKTRRVLITRKEHPVRQQKAATIFNRGVNEIYSTVNVEPGKEHKVSLFGQEVRAKELMGKQLEQVLPSVPEEVRYQYTMPIEATVPGSEEPMLFKSPEHLAMYMLNYNIKK